MTRTARLVGALLGATLLLTSFAAPALADTDNGKGDGNSDGKAEVTVNDNGKGHLDDVDAITTTAPGMHPGETAWVSVVWQANKTVGDFSATVTAPDGVTVAYPSGGPSTSLYGSSHLAKDTQDFCAFQLSVPYGTTGSVVLQVHARWDGSHGTDVTVTVPLTPYVGPDLTWSTPSVQVPRGTPGWVDVGLTGGAPRLDHVRVTVQGPAGLVVTYPADGSSSGLNGADSLQGGASDHAGVRLDAGALAPGTYPLTVTVAYDAPDHRTQQEQLSLVVS